jgi:energy-coupling factor transporter transmembrane protein EcfT
MAWLTFIIVILMHIFCFLDKKIKERTLWSFTYFLYHLFLVIWLLLAMGYAYNWSSKQ